MFHHDRVWCVTPAESAEDLARKLTDTTWTSCTGFSLAGYLWLNDSTSPDGCQEFAVVKHCGPNGRPMQVESITFSWCDYETYGDFAVMLSLTNSLRPGTFWVWGTFT